jgi:hypothetical protein
MAAVLRTHEVSGNAAEHLLRTWEIFASKDLSGTRSAKGIAHCLLIPLLLPWA